MTDRDLEAYCDESYGHDEDGSSWYVVAGYIGKATQWRQFEVAWRRHVLPTVRDIGFHANRCARGRGEYEAVDEQARNEIQRLVIRTIEISGVAGLLASIDMEAYREVKARLRFELDSSLHKYENPYLLAARQFVQLACSTTASKKKIAFTFHQRPKGRLGSMPPFYDHMSAHSAAPIEGRLGPASWRSQKDVLPLNAADLLAYCGYRHLTGDHTPWQWEALNRLRAGVHTYAHDRRFWTMIVDEIEREASDIEASPTRS